MGHDAEGWCSFGRIGETRPIPEPDGLTPRDRAAFLGSVARGAFGPRWKGEAQALLRGGAGSFPVNRQFGRSGVAPTSDPASGGIAGVARAVRDGRTIGMRYHGVVEAARAQLERERPWRAAYARRLP